MEKNKVMGMGMSGFMGNIQGKKILIKPLLRINHFLLTIVINQFSIYKFHKHHKIQFKIQRRLLCLSLLLAKES